MLPLVDVEHIADMHTFDASAGRSKSELCENGFYVINSSVLRWISTEGRRSDVAHNFIYDKPRDNLTIMTGHLVKKVLFE